MTAWQKYLDRVDRLNLSLDYFNGTIKVPDTVDHRVVKRICNIKDKVA